MNENTTNLEIDKLIEIFIESDDFCKSLDTYLATQNPLSVQPTRVPQLAPS